MGGVNKDVDQPTEEVVEDTNEDPEKDSEGDLFSDEKIPDELEETRRNMNKKFTQTQQRLTKKEAEFEAEKEKLQMADAMVSELYEKSPQFRKIITAYMNGEDVNADIQPTEPKAKGDRYAKYGENAEAYKALIGDIKEELADYFGKELEPIKQSVSKTNRSNIMNDLSSWVKDQRAATGIEFPDPKIYELEIRSKMDSGMSAREAYSSSVQLGKLKVRPSIEEKNNNEKKKLSSTRPGGSGSLGVPKTKLTVDDYMNMSNDDKKKLPTWDEQKEKVLAKFRSM